MKAGILYDDEVVRVGEAPDPQIGPHEVLVKPAYAGICGTDVHVFQGEFHGRVTYPAILGHEFGGTIEAVGADVRDYHVGDRVSVDPIMPCHRCTACLSGFVNVCQNLKLLGIDLAGGFGQYVAVPERQLYCLPDDVPMLHVPMVEMYALGHHILKRGEVQPGETVVILGTGKLGLSVLDVLTHQAGAVRSIVTDLQPFRLETASEVGADVAIDIRREDPVERVMALTDGTGADCVIEAVGHYHLVEGQEPPLAQAVRMVRPGGRIVTAGLGEQLSAVHFKTLVLKEARIIGSRVTLGEFPRAIQLMSKGLLHPNLLITHQMALGEIDAAFVQAGQADTIKVVLDVQDA
jgi:(R,R)-butanediol dehydrogenase/meso-butanediol dehydrogenase/diacetyl reductase